LSLSDRVVNGALELALSCPVVTGLDLLLIREEEEVDADEEDSVALVNPLASSVFERLARVTLLATMLV
jgi:hypothetical protein